jgi:hypothetical protein
VKLQVNKIYSIQTQVHLAENIGMDWLTISELEQEYWRISVRQTLMKYTLSKSSTESILRKIWGRASKVKLEL